MYKIYKIGLLGFGHIGKGVNKVLESLSKRQPVELVKIFDIEEKKEEIGPRFVSSIDEITDDPNIDVVIEALGGNAFPFECIKQALKAKKHVITSNKEVVSKHIIELLALAHTNDVFFQFEASVGGGIPLINPLINLTKYDTIVSLRGILNSTTNIILTQMQDNNMSLEKALDYTKELGVVEKDYQMDLLGYDLAQKIALLSSLAFKSYVEPKLVPRRGIQGINLDIIKDINSKGYYLKFLAEAKLETDTLRIGVEPALVNINHQLVSIKNDYSDICIILKDSGKIQFAGKGSGSIPASCSIESDIIRVIENNGYIQNIDINNYKIEDLHTKTTKYYVYKDNKSFITTFDEIEKINPEFYARISD